MLVIRFGLPLSVGGRTDFGDLLFLPLSSGGRTDFGDPFCLPLSFGGRTDFGDPFRFSLKPAPMHCLLNTPSHLAHPPVEASAPDNAYRGS